MVSIEKYFDIAYSAPDGIKKLREMILILAIQGKLVPQDSNDKPASELLKSIQQSKEKLIKEGKSRRQATTKVEYKEIPFVIPSSWQWVRLGDIGDWKAGSTPNRSNSSYYVGKIPWVKSGEVKVGLIKETKEHVSDLALKDYSLKINSRGAVLVAMYGANIGEVGILDIEATSNQAVCACELYTGVSNEFLLHFITYHKKYFISQGAGAAQPNISREKIITTPFPLPPEKEQKRIVDRINMLLACCDELEKLRSDKKQKLLTVHTGAITTLLQVKVEKDFDSAWRFIMKNFSELYAVKENVAELRKAILKLAVMGKIVSQDPKGKPASHLLKEIQTEKEKLIKSGKIKKQKPLPSITEKEIPYQIPKGWEWGRLGDICSLITDGEHQTPKRLSTGKMLLSAKNVRDGYIDYSDHDLISKEDFDKAFKRCGPMPNDILMVSVGATIGRCSIVTEPTQFVLVRSVALIRTMLSPRYVDLFLKSPEGQKQIGLSQKATGQPCLYLEPITRFMVPVPPMEEQHRIIEKVNALMTLCDEIESEISSVEKIQTSLLSAIAI